VYSFEILDSYIEIEDGNKKEAQWLRSLAENVLRVFETLEKDDDTLFNNLMKVQRKQYAEMRDKLDSQKGVFVKLRGIGHDDSSHDEESSSDEGQDEPEFQYRENVGGKKKKKNTGFNMADL
jgi:hypothetical protein